MVQSHLQPVKCMVVFENQSFADVSVAGDDTLNLDILVFSLNRGGKFFDAAKVSNVMTSFDHYEI